MTENNLKLLKKNISNIDLHFIVHELNEILKDGFISNVYELPNTEILRIKCRSKEGKKNLIIDPQTRVNITQFKYPTDRYPSQFIMGLRKFMKGRRIEEIYQYNFDRIIVFQLKSSDEKPWKFVVELFGKGNYILMDGENRTVFAKHYKKFRNRVILAKKPYDFPGAYGINLKELTKENLIQLIEEKENDLVRVLARAISVGGYVIEEMCKRAGIDKLKDTSAITSEDIDKLYNEFDSFRQKLLNFTYTPALVLNEEEIPVGFEPLKLEIYNNYTYEFRDTFNEVIDDFFSRFETDKLYGENKNKSNKKVKKYEKILEQQKKSIVNLGEKRVKYQKIADLIYQNMYHIDNLINTVMNQKREKDKSWGEITRVLKAGKEKGIPECEIFERIFKKEMKIRVNLDGTRYKLDLYKNASDNAQYLYEKAAKCSKKIKGAKIAIEKTKEKIDKVKDKHVQIEQDTAILLKQPKKNWYEKYRWFKSSDGFLVIGGRSASSNEAIVKKHMNPNDLFFHTEVRGAAVCLIKNDEGKEIPETTIEETAKFAACYSSAWKKGWGKAKVFYVRPEQVSKTPQSGEYLTKGSFIITGEKNYLTRPELELSIGVELIPVNVPMGYEHVKENLEINAESEIVTMKEDGEEVQYFPKIISAPTSAITKQTPIYVPIKPSKERTKTSDLAKMVLNLLVKQTPEPLQKWVKLASLDAIIRKIPAGGGKALNP